MASDKWLRYGGVELVNLSRTAQLSEALDIDVLLVDPIDVEWIEDALDGEDYGFIESAPWYDPGHEASMEFAGIVPLSIPGLDDSTLEATTTEYVTAGGSSGKARAKTLPLVASVAILASTERGADFGKRWLARVLAGGGAQDFCSGSELRYFQYTQADDQPVPPQAHRRDVSLSRGISVTRKRSSYCSAVWFVTFTWTANDPFEYGEEVPQFTGLGGAATGPSLASSGSLSMTEQECPVYDYSPIYDPLYPALVTPPTAPNFYPEGWTLLPGVDFTRFWARTNPVEPSTVGLVPVLTLTTSTEARMVRVSVWPSDADVAGFCDPLWEAVVSYLPPGADFIIDGEQEAAYAWDGVSPQIRRTDSLVYGAGADPVGWVSFNDPDGLLVTLDIMDGEGAGTVRAALSLVPKSD